MISLNEMREHVNNLNIPEDQREDLMTLLHPSFDFSKYLQKKLDITEDESEQLIQARIASRRDELNEGLQGLGLDVQDYMSLAATRMSNIIREFAEEHDYSEAEALQISLEKLMLIALNQRIASQHLNN